MSLSFPYWGKTPGKKHTHKKKEKNTIDFSRLLAGGKQENKPAKVEKEVTFGVTENVFHA